VVAVAVGADEEWVRDVGAQEVLPRGADLGAIASVDGVLDAVPVGPENATPARRPCGSSRSCSRRRSCAWTRKRWPGWTRRRDRSREPTRSVRRESRRPPDGGVPVWTDDLLW